MKDPVTQNLYPKEATTTYHQAENKSSQYLQNILQQVITDEQYVLTVDGSVDTTNYLENYFKPYEAGITINEQNVTFNIPQLQQDYKFSSKLIAMNYYTAIIEKYMKKVKPVVSDTFIKIHNLTDFAINTYLLACTQFIDDETMVMIDDAVEHLDDIQQSEFDWIPDYSKTKEVMQVIVKNITYRYKEGTREDDSGDYTDKPEYTNDEWNTMKNLDNVNVKDIFADSSDLFIYLITDAMYYRKEGDKFFKTHEILVNDLQPIKGEILQQDDFYYIIVNGKIILLDDTMLCYVSLNKVSEEEIVKRMVYLIAKGYYDLEQSVKIYRNPIVKKKILNYFSEHPEVEKEYKYFDYNFKLQYEKLINE